MHEILVISGKGGTGKTSITAAFAHLAKGAVLCDLDVDAPDLHLILGPRPFKSEPFVSGYEPRVDGDRCCACGRCEEMCRFEAIRMEDGIARVDQIRCEGCGVCVKFCPEEIIEFLPKTCGQWWISETRFGFLVHAQLNPGEENSGKLVALLRQKARELAESKGASLILSDGPPGIGCPVISSLTGTDLAVLVTEPTPSGLHDLKRIAELCDHFHIPAMVLINKSDLNKRMAERIELFSEKAKLPVLMKLPNDTDFVTAMVQGQAITEFSHGLTCQMLNDAWHKILKKAVVSKAA